MTNSLKSLLPCPWCGGVPTVGPQFPERDGNAWGFVHCLNVDCPAQPHIEDGETIADERGSDAYKAAAIARWNTRAPIAEGIDDSAWAAKILTAHNLWRRDAGSDGEYPQQAPADIGRAIDIAIESLSRQGGDSEPDDDWHLRGYAYASKQATNCAQCGEYRHTPLRVDAMDGYVCLTCIDKKLDELFTRASEAEGWVLVPREPTTAMQFAGARSWIDGQESRPGTSTAEEAVRSYTAMIAAAPANGGGK